MIPNLILRPVNVEDIAALHRNLWPDMDISHIQVRIAGLQEHPFERAWALVAALGEEVVGYGQLSQWGRRAEICDVVIAETWRGQGLGTMLIYRLIHLAREHGFPEVEIGAAESNPRAVALYQRLGFRASRRMMLDQGMGNGLEPIVYLTVDLRKTVCE